MIPIHAIAIYAIAAAAIAGVLARPWRLPEAVWASVGALLLMLTGLLRYSDALRAAAKAGDVCLFLAGMMLLSELARREGVFDWCAAIAVNHARRSPVRLFWLIYTVGVAVTVFLSNDATAVVMTPAVLAAARAAKVRTPLPYLLACAFVANAASFVLPISNPANLVLFAGRLPPLREWLAMFALPSLVSVAATAGALFLVMRKDLTGDVHDLEEEPRLSRSGRLALLGIILAAVVLIAASAFGKPLGLSTLCVAAVALALAAGGDRTVLWEVPRAVSWSVIPLVIGLFMVVEAANGAGLLAASSAALSALARLPLWQGNFASALAITALSNLINNLPSGLIAGSALAGSPAASSLRAALLIGVDLGPNLSITGSLATILWLIALRREGQHVSAWSFLKAGAIVMPVALLATILVSTI